jgi:hypothetical protein
MRHKLTLAPGPGAHIGDGTLAMTRHYQAQLAVAQNVASIETPTVRGGA